MAISKAKMKEIEALRISGATWRVETEADNPRVTITRGSFTIDQLKALTDYTFSEWQSAKLEEYRAKGILTD